MPARREKGSGTEFKISDTRWMARAEMPRDPATGKRRRISATGRTRTEAREKLKTKIEQLQREGTMPSAHAPMLRDYSERWLKLAATRVKPRVLETYHSECNSINSMIGGMRLDEITPASINTMLTELGRTRSPKTVLNHYIRLKQILNNAVREQLITSNPALATDPPRVEPSETRILDAGQPVQAINATLQPERRKYDMIHDSDADRQMWALMFDIAFATGMRQAERFAITPAELVTRDGIHGIQVEWELQRLNGEPQIPAWLTARRIDEHHWLLPPKSRNGKRFVPLSTEHWIALRELAGRKHAKPNDLIFTAPDGRPLNGNMERIRWRRALEDAGLPYVTMRAARHFFSTHLAEQGASEDARKAMMGHAKITTTAGYTHWTPETLAALADGARAAIGDGES